MSINFVKASSIDTVRCVPHLAPAGWCGVYIGCFAGSHEKMGFTNSAIIFDPEPLRLGVQSNIEKEEIEKHNHKVHFDRIIDLSFEGLLSTQQRQQLLYTERLQTAE